ncbi:protein AAR2 homolog [Episyrphus balteatus]|uniref:protein AAR2 homolog n=1 Tax=Episyrphus balteatus TaxID=286459 RepID=UPI0024850B3D|nr:protein AAR2 homolog [Episyrphus balteatus]
MNVDNSTMELDPEVAKRLFAQGAVLIIAGVPIGTQFGIDLCSYTIGEKFRGIKMVPPGPHYVYCESQGPYGDSAPRVGFVHYFHCNEILVREWDNENEELRERQIADPELEKRRIRENLLDLDEFLAPYDYRYAGDWKHLTDTVSEEAVNRCRPALGTIRTNVELQSCPDSERPRGVPGVSPKITKITSEDELLPNLKPIEGTGPRFTELPERVPKDATPEEITKHYMDCSQAVEELMELFDNPEKLIEEVQLAFVMFLIGYSIESLAQWRKTLNLLANSEVAVQKFKIFFMKYCEVLQHQLPHLPEELMEPTEHNTVYKDVRSLLINLTVSGLSVSAERLRKMLAKRMKWEFVGLMDDDPEDLPVVVET